MHILDPVIFFFIIGGIAQLVKSDLRIPEDFYNTISIYLLLAIGIKGGLELYKSEIGIILYPVVATIIIGPMITFIAYFILRVLKFDHINSTAIAAHYGSCSAVTFAVVADLLKNAGILYEQFSTVLLVIFEIPGIAAAILISRIKSASVFSVKRLLHDVFFGKSILLLTGGLFIGYVIGYSGNKQLDFFFLDLFKGFLALFMLEMGIVAAKKLNDLRQVGFKLLAFGIGMPMIASFIGIAAGILSGLSLGGTIILATLAASASYIAAPAAVQIVLPSANPTLYITPAIGVTLPFNLIIGIQIYTFLTTKIFDLIKN